MDSERDLGRGRKTGQPISGPPTDPRPGSRGKRWGPGEISGVTSWPIGKPPWLWGTRIRILFVMDGRIRATYNPEAFGLGLVVDTMRDFNFPTWWVRFELTLAHRDSPSTREVFGGETETPEEFSKQFDFTQFRFTQPGFDIDDYDQVWLFGDWPGIAANDSSVGDDLITSNPQWAMEDGELLVLAQWMDRGGGVFATGDHAMLGASLCHRVPRVRSMRRWTRAQGVPTHSGSGRNETVIHVTPYPLQDEKDRWPQRIFPEVRETARGPFLYGAAPHPVLCGRAGVIDHMPDHMHEGGLFEDHEVRLDDPLDIPDYERPEYPRLEPVVASAAAIGGASRGLEAFGIRPRSHVIAHGLTTNPNDPPRVFPMIAVYDGDAVGLGRVVVDSTWHHWFTYNLLGLRDLAPGVYASIQDYYRNVALWLATPQQRASMLFAATWGSIVGTPPGALDVELGLRGVGERVVDVIGRSAPQCILDELVATVSSLPAATPREEEDDQSWMWPPSGRNLTAAVVGSVALPMIRLANDLLDDQTRGHDSEPDLDEIHRMGYEGVRAAHQELRAGFLQARAKYEMYVDMLAKEGGEAQSD
jgi:hypothetical protein